MVSDVRAVHQHHQSDVYFLGCFVIAREWDRKTIESLATTNVSALQIVLSKVIVYYLLSLWAVFIILGLGSFYIRSRSVVIPCCLF